MKTCIVPISSRVIDLHRTASFLIAGLAYGMRATSPAKDFQLQDYPLRLGVCSSDAGKGRARPCQQELRIVSIFSQTSLHFLVLLGGPPDHGFVTINLEQILHSRTELDPDEPFPHT